MRLITLNGVKLLVYRNGMILRYSDKVQGDKVKKGWNTLYSWISDKGYRVIKINQKKYFLHRILAYSFIGLDIENKKQIVDHISRDTLDNRIENLRIVSKQENNWNTNAKGYTRQGGKYTTRIKVNKQIIYLGYFDTEEEAHQAYLDAKAKYHIIPDTPN